MNIITLLMAGIFIGNLITSSLLGIENLQNKREKSLCSLLKSDLVIAALLLAFTAVTYPLGKFVIAPLELGFLSALIFTLIILGALFGIYVAADKFLPRLSGFLKENCDTAALLPLLLAVCLMNLQTETILNLGTALLYTLICSVGYAVVSVIFFTVNDRLKTAELPETVKGLPITLIILSLISLAFGGFAGI